MLSLRDAMCKTQWCLVLTIVLLGACSILSSHGRGSAAAVSSVGDRGGHWPGGIGAVLRFRESQGVLTVHEAPPSGAAARAGLREGDVIDAIDGEPVSGHTEHEVVTRLRGDVGDVVVLRVRGADGGVGRDVRVERGPYTPRGE